MTFFLCLVVAATGILRVVGVKAVAYQALAHILVGGLYGGAVAGGHPRRWLYLGLAVALTALEAICFYHGTR